MKLKFCVFVPKVMSHFTSLLCILIKMLLKDIEELLVLIWFFIVYRCVSAFLSVFINRIKYD